MQTNKAGVAPPDLCAGAMGQPRSRRWPQPDDGQRYGVILGGSATLGKSVDQPFPALVAAAVGLPVINLGALNAGPDAYLSDAEALTLISRAEVAVVQVPGAETLSNPFYTVHSRRNDRFLAATPALQTLFPEVDLTDIHFARHLLQVLSNTDTDRFAVVAGALKATWVARMQSLLVHLPLRRRLLWLSDAPPPDHANSLASGPGPLLVDAGMLARLRPLAGQVIVAVPAHEARASKAAPDTGFQPTGLPGSAAHRQIAAMLVPEMLAQLAIGRPPTLMLRLVDAVP